MKKLLLSVCALALAFGAQAQKAQKTQSDAELGKKWYVAERYSKALPYLERASEAGDVDSKARLAYMIYTAQVPEYSMDQDEAMNMLDECIEKGSTLAMERKGMCLLAFPPETKENRLKAIEILKEASDKGSGDASANLFNAYANGITSYARNEVYVEPNDSLALVYIKKACEQARPVLLEPIMKVEVVTPEESMGDVISDLNKRRGQVEGMESSRSGARIVKAKTPLAEMFGYVTALRTITSGRATSTMTFSHYAEVSTSIAKAVLTECQGRVDLLK